MEARPPTIAKPLLLTEGLDYGHEESSTESLNWRLEQHRAFSDWSIVVSSQPPRTVIPYGCSYGDSSKFDVLVGRKVSRLFPGYEQAFEGVVQGWRHGKNDELLFKVSVRSETRS